MRVYEFAIILKDEVELTDDVADALFNAGCDDAIPGTCNRVFSISFNREAESLEEAIRSAVANVQAAGYEVDRAEVYIEHENSI